MSSQKKKVLLSSQFESLEVSTQLPVQYLHFNQGPKKPLLILFHGYEDTAAGVFRRAITSADQFPEFEILAPNGLFPVPVKLKGGGWKQTFAWYFADYSRKQVLIPPQVSAGAIADLIEKLDLRDRPKILIGFSQGGFFIPFVYPALTNVKKLFTIGSAYRQEDYPAQMGIALDAIHGTEDKVISFDRAESSFNELKAKNPEGRFFSFNGLGHSMNDESRALLKKEIYGVRL